MFWRPAVLFVLGACATASPGTFNDSVTGDAHPSGDAPQQQHGDAAPTSGCSFTGALATWDLSGQTGSETMVPAATNATGVTAGELTRAAALTATSGTGSINSSGWPTTGALDATKYYAFTVSPPSGCSIKLTGVAIDVKSSGTGPATGALATSADAFGSTTTVSTAAASTPTMTTTSSTTLEIHVYGYSATGSSGTMRIQNTLTVNGSIL